MRAVMLAVATCAVILPFQPPRRLQEPQLQPHPRTTIRSAVQTMNQHLQLQFVKRGICDHIETYSGDSYNDKCTGVSLSLAPGWVWGYRNLHATREMPQDVIYI